MAQVAGAGVCNAHHLRVQASLQFYIRSQSTFTLVVCYAYYYQYNFYCMYISYYIYDLLVQSKIT